MKPLDKNQANRQTRRNLPHWEQAGCTSFLPWRLADSLPATKLDEWKQVRTRRLRAQSNVIGFIESRVHG